MQTGKSIGAFRLRCQFGDAERRGVGAEDRGIADDRVERGVGLRLLVDVLDDRFDDDVARAEVVELRGAGEIRERPLLVLRRHFALLHAARQELVDPPQPFLDQRVLDLADDRLVASGGRDLRDSRAHEAATENADCFDLHRMSPSAFLTARGAPPPLALARGRRYAALPSGPSLGPQALAACPLSLFPYTVSTIAAIPCPPPIHAVASPRFRPRRRSSSVSVSSRRVPVMPSG